MASESVRVDSRSTLEGPYAARAGELCSPGLPKLFPEFQFASDSDVAGIVGFVEIIQQTTTLADHLEQPAAGAVVLHVLLQVFRQMVDPLGEQRDLHVRRPCVFGVRLE